MWVFNQNELLKVIDALEIAEDVIGDYYKFSVGQWKRHRYDVKTSLYLKRDEKSKYAFALLNKGSRLIGEFDPTTKKRDFYFICLQDGQIIKALRRDKDLDIISLLVYIFTHELVHIVRFCNFNQRFEVTGKTKEKEESTVHGICYEILNQVPLPRLGYVLDSYRDHRVFEMALSQGYEVGLNGGEV